MKYAAFLRGIMPMNPNMRNEKIRGVLESLGLKNVQSVIASGNFVFESGTKDVSALEIKIEAALKKEHNINCPTFIRSEDDLKKIVKKDPFDGAAHSRETYLIVTFLKTKPFEVYNIVDVSGPRTPEFMKDTEKKYGKLITTRTWKTIERILKKME